MEKYNIFNYYIAYCESTLILPKLTWKRIAINAIRQYHTEQWTGRVTEDPEFVQFSVVHPHIRAACLSAATRTPHETTDASTAASEHTDANSQTSLQTLWPHS
ncbi:hypothetical protein DPMN_039704 [Dreissena polymorpha]|uniref:Uncharacterized protein n=1 Tax=Dreissena polymorpha TaxID=45954 RepID=A0A9D4CWD7_DREPO|nr:hypothetical protein DPMN_039704 [Dreissena polymorpha]